jgi:hypothetical protein
MVVYPPSLFGCHSFSDGSKGTAENLPTLKLRQVKQKTESVNATSGL